jgi:hypothetical protein
LLAKSHRSVLAYKSLERQKKACGRAVGRKDMKTEILQDVSFNQRRTNRLDLRNETSAFARQFF